MSDLIARLESASSNSWELDCDIMEAIGLPETYIGSKVLSWRRYKDAAGQSRFACRTLAAEHDGISLAPNFTASVDAAMSIAHPPGHHLWTISVDGRLSREPGHCTWRVEITIPSSEFQGHARTQPLAICAAALRMLADPRIAACRGLA